MNKTKKKIIISIISMIIICLVFVISKSYSLTKKHPNNVIETKDSYISFTIDGVSSNIAFPSKNDGYMATSVTCLNGTTAEWDNDKWGLVNIVSNNKNKVNCNVNFITSVWNFNYTGNAQSFPVTRTGTYKIELWGASGGDIINPSGGEGLEVYGGKGAYTSGNVELTSGEEVYVYVGQGSTYCGTDWQYNYNGGGSGGCRIPSQWYGGNGGGATDVRFEGNTLFSRTMVAAGGGGAGYQGNWGYGNGGAAGGLVGYTPTGSTSRVDSFVGSGAGQTYPGNTVNTDRQNRVCLGSFGKGGHSCYVEPSNYNGYNTGGGGGGGYYGGGGSSDSSPGGGGSSFISGYSGCNAIDSSSTESNIIHKNSPNHDNMVFTNGVMIDGEGCNWSTGSATNCGANQPQPDGTNTTGHTGNGFARITLLN